MAAPRGSEDETIVALATPVGNAALAVVRVSGPLAATLAADGPLGTRPLAARRAVHRDYHAGDGRLIDDVVAVLFPGPRSYTGEDVLELSTHGNPHLVQRVIDDLCARGCRPARPGEFTQRAFLSGRMDLSQAEAVMDVIRARSDRSLELAQRQLRGELGRRLAPLEDGLLQALAEIEAYIDFPEEDLPIEDRQRVVQRLEAVRSGVQDLLATRRVGAWVRDGIRTVIVGQPNAGKSSLLNRLVGYERALVSPEPGTTRDFLEEGVRVGPHVLRLVDTAGFNDLTNNELEKKGISLGARQMAEADLVLWVIDLADPSPARPPPVASSWLSERTLIVGNKQDLVSPPAAAAVLAQAVASLPAARPGPSFGATELAGPSAWPSFPAVSTSSAAGGFPAADGGASVPATPSTFRTPSAPSARAAPPAAAVSPSPSSAATTAPSSPAVTPWRSVSVSAVAGTGIETLLAAIEERANQWQQAAGAEAVAVSARHEQALLRAAQLLDQVLGPLRRTAAPTPPLELLASDLRGALEALGEILGRYDPERMLDRLFATFCIGK